MRQSTATFCAIFVLALFGSRADAINIQLVPFANGFSKPIFVTHAGDGSGRLFVVEQTGRIKILNSTGGSLGEFLNVSSLLFDATGGGEQGLLGLAFHPGYPGGGGKFYIHYSGTGGGPAGQTVIAEYTVSANPDIANTTETRLLLIPDPEGNHNGGWTAFGSDDFLYIAIGDGGGGEDIHGTIGNGQDMTTTLGKMLRIDVDTDGFPGDPNRNYAIPAGNPFAASAGSEAKEIFASGLRNPWRCSFDRVTGELYCGDVGQYVYEEVDIITNGGNYGWRCMEGFHPGFQTAQANCLAGGFIDPIHEYAHGGVPADASITGGYVYRGSAYPTIAGLYFFADYNSGRIRTLDGNCASACASTDRITAPFNVSSFGEDEAGELYVCGYSDGVIYKLIDADTPTPTPTLNTVQSWELFE